MPGSSVRAGSDFSTPPAYGTNIIPLKMSRGELLAGTTELLRSLYDRAAFFERQDALFLEGGRLGKELGRLRYLRRHPWQRLKTNALWLIQTLAVLINLMCRVPDARLRREYRWRMWRVVMRRCEPIVLRDYAFKCALHYHMHVMVWRDRNVGTGFSTSENIDQPAEGDARLVVPA